MFFRQKVPCNLNVTFKSLRNYEKKLFNDDFHAKTGMAIKTIENYEDNNNNLFVMGVSDPGNQHLFSKHALIAKPFEHNDPESSAGHRGQNGLLFHV